jgi:hypothetical protein
MSEDKEKALMRKTDRLIEGRRVFERSQQDIRELVRPVTTDFTGGSRKGDVRSERVYDGTAIDAAQQLASGIVSFIVNPTERWFGLSVQGFSTDDYDEDALAWLELVCDIIYDHIGQPQTGFSACMHESALDIASFGYCNPYSEYSTKKGCLSFRAIPLASSYFSEDSEGFIDTVMRRTAMDLRQCRQQFPSLPKKLNEKPDNNEVTLRHLVCPRTDRDIHKIDQRNKPYASYWLCEETKELILESGYDQPPYHAGRWMKVPDEVYGTGPAAICLPDIKMLNVMERTLIRAGQKVVDPPLQVPDEGFLTQINTAPGSILIKEPGAEHIEPLLTGANLQWGLEQAEQKRIVIRNAFHAAWLKMEKENKEMTAFEVADRRNEKLMLLAPMMGRLQMETLGPMLRRIYSLLHARGHFPPAPASLQGRKLAIIYTSPAARAQLSVKANEMGRYVQELIPLAQIRPDILDAVNWDKYAKKLAEYRGVTRTILVSEKELAANRAAKQQAAAAQQMAAVAEPASKALKNVADAQSKGMNLAGLI